MDILRKTRVTALTLRTLLSASRIHATPGRQVQRRLQRRRPVCCHRRGPPFQTVAVTEGGNRPLRLMLVFLAHGRPYAIFGCTRARHIRYRGPVTWNKLKPEIQQLSSQYSFKILLEQYLIDSY